MEDFTKLGVESLDELTENMLNDAKENPNLGDFNLIESKEIRLGGQPGYKMVFNGIDDEYNIGVMYMMAWTIYDGRAYFLNFAAQISEYSKWIGTIEDMLASFEIL